MIPTILQSDDSYESDCNLPPSYSRHRRAIIAAMAEVADAAVAAERVRCAKIADSFVRAAVPYRNDPPAEQRADDTAISIAARIREGQ